MCVIVFWRFKSSNIIRVWRIHLIDIFHERLACLPWIYLDNLNHAGSITIRTKKIKKTKQNKTKNHCSFNLYNHCSITNFFNLHKPSHALVKFYLKSITIVHYIQFISKSSSLDYCQKCCNRKNIFFGKC